MNILYHCYFLADAEWFDSLPESVHACFYQSASADPAALTAFAKCQKSDEPRKCILEVPAARECLNRASGH